MSLKSPSKFLPLSYLEEIRSNYYCSQTGVDYVPIEVDDLIFDKMNKQNEKVAKKQELEYQSFEIAKLKESGIKWCSQCKVDKKFSEFDRDESKKIFKLRSHCKVCRKIKREKCSGEN